MTLTEFSKSMGLMFTVLFLLGMFDVIPMWLFWTGTVVIILGIFRFAYESHQKEQEEKKIRKGLLKKLED